MPQKIDIHGLFIDPETITDLLLQKRTAVFYPVFYETEARKSFFGRYATPQKHILHFDHQEPFGIVLDDAEQPDPQTFVVNYKEAALERLFKGLGNAGKNITGHITEKLKIDVSGDRKYRILQSGRIVKQVSLREIPAKVRLSSGQWVDVFKSSPEYDFQGGTPYAVTDVGSYALMISTKEKNHVLFGAGVDVSNDEVTSTYHELIEIYNQIQEIRDVVIEDKTKKPLFRVPQIGKSQIRMRPPFVGKRKTKTEDIDGITKIEDDDQAVKEIVDE